MQITNTADNDENTREEKKVEKNGGGFDRQSIKRYL